MAMEARLYFLALLGEGNNYTQSQIDWIPIIDLIDIYKII